MNKSSSVSCPSILPQRPSLVSWLNAVWWFSVPIFLSLLMNHPHLLPTLKMFKFHPLFWITKHVPACPWWMHDIVGKRVEWHQIQSSVHPQVPISPDLMTSCYFSTLRQADSDTGRKGLSTSHIRLLTWYLGRNTLLQSWASLEQQSNIPNDVGIDGSS